MRQVHHAIRLAPGQIVLNVGGQLGLYAEGDEGYGEEKGGKEVFLAGRGLGGLESAGGIARVHGRLAAEGAALRGRRRHRRTATGFGVVGVGGQL